MADVKLANNISSMSNSHGGPEQFYSNSDEIDRLLASSSDSESSGAESSSSLSSKQSEDEQEEEEEEEEEDGEEDVDKDQQDEDDDEDEDDEEVSDDEYSSNEDSESYIYQTVSVCDYAINSLQKPKFQLAETNNNNNNKSNQNPISKEDPYIPLEESLSLLYLKPNQISSNATNKNNSNTNKTSTTHDNTNKKATTLDKKPSKLKESSNTENNTNTTQRQLVSRSETNSVMKKKRPVSTLTLHTLKNANEKKENKNEDEFKAENYRKIKSSLGSLKRTIKFEEPLIKKESKDSKEVRERKFNLDRTNSILGPFTNSQIKKSTSNFNSMMDFNSKSTNSTLIQHKTQFKNDKNETTAYPTEARLKEAKIKTVMTVDTSKARSNSEVLRLCIAELGWQDCPNGLPSGCDIIWQSCTYHESRDQAYSYYSSASRINKFPCMNQLLKKGPLTLSLNVMRSLYKDEYDFYPRTWFLPEQFKEFSQECRYLHDQESRANKVLTTFIVKPNDGSQGDGIYLIKSPEEYLNSVPDKTQNQQSKSYIVQEYIHNPFLIDGLKSDFRIYVVIINIKPLEIYICDEGLVRFATVDYQVPNDENLSQIFMHLTNYSLNKKNNSYQFTSNITNDNDADSAGYGSKRKLTKIFSYMQNKGYNVNKIKAAIDDLVIKTIFALLPEMKVEISCETYNSPNKQRPSCFQIIGFDILLNDNLKPILLEVNCNPSLRIDYESETPDGRIINLPSPIDVDIKKPLILETLKLACPRKKLELIWNKIEKQNQLREKIKREEEQMEKAAKFRSFLVKQRIEQRLISAKANRRFDLEKFPLLSKPGEQYKKKLKLNSGHMTNSETISSKLNVTSSNPILNKSTNNNNSKSTSTSAASSASSSSSSSTTTSSSSSSSSSQSQHTCLRNIYPNNASKSFYNRLFVQENIADLFVFFTMYNGFKLMTHTDFRLFIKKCNLMSKKLTADNLDIIFFDLSKKWEMYNRKRVDFAGLCYQGFVECFTKLSRLIFDESTTEQSLKSLIYYCKYIIKQDGLKSNQYYNLEMSDLFYPLTLKLVNELEMLKPDIKDNNNSNNNNSNANNNNNSNNLQSVNNSTNNNVNLVSSTSAASSKNLPNETTTAINEASSLPLQTPPPPQPPSTGSSNCKPRLDLSYYNKKSKKSIFPIFFDTTV